MPRRLRRRTRARLWQAAAALGILAAAVAVWVGTPRSEPAASSPPRASSTPSAPDATATPSWVVSPPAPSATIGSLGGFAFPTSTSAPAFAAGPHDVVLEASSDRRIGKVGYETRGDERATLQAGVPSPMRLTARVAGPGLLAAMVVQVAPDASIATCRIIVDGVLASVETARGPNRVVVCLA